MAVGVEEALARLTRFVELHPELTVAILVSLLILVGGAYALHRFTRPAGVKFASLLADCDEVAVLTHPNPDPDAMAAAMGVACLASHAGAKTSIRFPGQIRHQENRAFRNVLEVDLKPIEKAADLDAEAVVLVDHNQPRGFTGAERIFPFAVVDHHPGEGVGEAFTDVRTEYGACSSVIAEYFQDLDAEPVPPDLHESEVNSEYILPSRVATGLLFGILTDTNNLTSGANTADFTASGYLYPGVDESLLDRIANPQVSADVLETKARAINERDIKGSFAISDVGDCANVDAIPQAVDELITLEGVTAAIVCGRRNGTLYLSGRSRDDRVHMGRALESALSDIPGASGGGHARMGGGQIPIDEDEFVWPGRRSTLSDRLRRALEGDV